MPPSPDSGEEGVEFKDLLRHLDREQAHVVVRLESRKFGKPVTVVQGLETLGKDLDEIAARLKHRLATGGSAKDGLVLLQGDHRNRVKDELVTLGIPTENIDLV